MRKRVQFVNERKGDLVYVLLLVLLAVPITSQAQKRSGRKRERHPLDDYAREFNHVSQHKTFEER